LRGRSRSNGQAGLAVAAHLLEALEQRGREVDVGGAADRLVGGAEGGALEGEVGVGALILAEDLEEDAVGVD
jgi:hypothetical protein